MSTMNKVISYVLFVIAAFLVVASFFKGSYLFYEACVYGVLGVCFMDTSDKEKEIKK